jgi:hypothetical protein
MDDSVAATALVLTLLATGVSAVHMPSECSSSVLLLMGVSLDNDATIFSFSSVLGLLLDMVMMMMMMSGVVKMM